MYVISMAAASSCLFWLQPAIEYSSCLVGMSLSTLKTKSPVDGITPADASKALRRYQIAGYDVAPEDEKAQSAYIQLRVGVGRVSAATFMSYFKSKQNEIETGAQTEVLYWGVPKTNFPTGLPPNLKDAEASREDLGNLTLLGGDSMQLDLDVYHIMDQCASRTDLGKNVVQLKFYTGGKTRFKGPPPAVPSSSRSALGSPPVTPLRRARGSRTSTDSSPGPGMFEGASPSAAPGGGASPQAGDIALIDIAAGPDRSSGTGLGWQELPKEVIDQVIECVGTQSPQLRNNGIACTSRLFNVRYRKRHRQFVNDYLRDIITFMQDNPDDDAVPTLLDLEDVI